MKLGFKDFYYLDSPTVDNLYGYLLGFIPEGHKEVDVSEGSTQKSIGAKYIVEANAGKDTKTGKEISREGTVNTKLRYDQLFDELKERGLEQKDFLEKDEWDKLIMEEEFIELRGSLHFTEVYELEKQAKFIGRAGMALNKFADKKDDNFKEEEVQKVLNQIAQVKDIQEKNGIPIKLKTFDEKYTFIAYLDSEFLVKEQQAFKGNDYKMLCKIERKIPQGKNYDLFNIEELENKLLNRNERRNKKGTGLREEFKEKVTGPAAIVLPVAIYR